MLLKILKAGSHYILVKREHLATNHNCFIFVSYLPTNYKILNITPKHWEKKDQRCLTLACHWNCSRKLCSFPFGSLSILLTTFGQQQLEAHLLTPAWRFHIPRVCIDPEVIALRITIEMKSYSVTLDLRAREHNHRLFTSHTTSIKRDFLSRTKQWLDSAI